ncbi:MAG: family 10 glycosylhydrolase [Candidatus Fermentibacteraceae bacterium]
MIPLVLAIIATGEPIQGVWVAKGYPGDWGEAAFALQNAGVDHVLPCFLYGITPAYISDIVPDSPGFPADPEWVESILTECGTRGIEVHAWVVLWKSTNADSSLLDSLAGAGRLQVNLEGDTQPWLCPTNPANLELETALLFEMLERYPLDGVQFDYVRFPNGSTCYCEGCRTRFQEQTGLTVITWPDDAAPTGSLGDRFAAWRVGRITQALAVLSEAVRTNGILVSVAVLPDYHDALDCGQDWVDWSRQGIVDRIYLMDYFRTTPELEEALSVQISLLPRGFFTVCGLGSGIGSLEISPMEAASQVEAALRGGARGVCHFHLNETLLQALPVIQGYRSCRER